MTEIKSMRDFYERYFPSVLEEECISCGEKLRNSVLHGGGFSHVSWDVRKQELVQTYTCFDCVKEVYEKP